MKIEFKFISSPFTKKRKDDKKVATISFRVPKDIKKDVTSYFNSKYDDKPLTSGMNDLIMDMLNKICFNRKSFLNLFYFMLIPKTTNVDELNEYSKIIGFVDVVEEDKFNKMNHSYLKKGNKYRLGVKAVPLKDVPPNRFYRDSKNYFKLDLTNIKTNSDVLKEIRKVYPDVDVNNTYFLFCHLNNVLDVFREGQYQDNTINNAHNGANIVYNETDDFNTFFIYKWEYLHELHTLELDLKFYNETDFIKRLKKSEDNNQLMKDFIHFTKPADKRKFLLELRKNIEEHLKEVNELIKKDFPDDF